MDNNSPLPSPIMPQTLVPPPQSGNKKFAIVILTMAVIGALALAAVWYWQKNQQLQQLPVQADKSTDLTSISDWETYQSDTYGFELKIPTDWQVEDDKKGNFYFNSAENIQANEKFDQQLKANHVEGTDAGPARFNIVISYLGDKALDEYIKATNDFYFPQQDTLFAGHNAVLGIQGGLGSSYVMYVEKDNHLYSIGSPLNSYGMDLQLYYKILATLKFI